MSYLCKLKQSVFVGQRWAHYFASGWRFIIAACLPMHTHTLLIHQSPPMPYPKLALEHTTTTLVFSITPLILMNRKYTILDSIQVVEKCMFCIRSLSDSDGSYYALEFAIVNRLTQKRTHGHPNTTTPYPYSYIYKDMEETDGILKLINKVSS